MVGVGRRGRKRRGDRAFPHKADFPHAHSRRDGRKQAFAGRELSSNPGGVRAARWNDKISVRKPAVAGGFCMFGQLSELATDPSPMRIMREKAPFTDHWTRRLDDASGVDGQWYPRELALSGMAEALLRIAGELYLPFLVANAEAFAKGVE